MRVSQSGNNPVQGSEVKSTRHTHHAHGTHKSRGAEGAEGAAATDGASASISPRAREMARAKETASSAPDVREERIAELKRRIADGKYQIDADGIADRLVDDHLKSGIG